MDDLGFTMMWMILDSLSCAWPRRHHAKQLYHNLAHICIAHAWSNVACSNVCFLCILGLCVRACMRACMRASAPRPGCATVWMWQGLNDSLFVTWSVCDTVWEWHGLCVTRSGCDMVCMWHGPFVTLSMCDTVSMWHGIYITRSGRDMVWVWVFLWHGLCIKWSVWNGLCVTWSVCDTVRVWHSLCVTRFVCDTAGNDTVWEWHGLGVTWSVMFPYSMENL